jgi:predicted O-methyltransferase YrrM
MSNQTLDLNETLLAYILDVGVDESDIMKRLREETMSLEMARMQIAPEQGAFMGFIASLIGAKNYLEIGTFTGYSMLSIASGMGEGFRAVACDVSKEWTDIARRYWKEAAIDKQIELKLGPALKSLDTLQTGSFDIAFIDADKTNYDAYYEACLKLLKDQGLLLIDNIFWDGGVADMNIDDPDTRAIRALNEKIMKDSRVKATMVSIGDGLMMVHKVVATT